MMKSEFWDGEKTGEFPWNIPCLSSETPKKPWWTPPCLMLKIMKINPLFEAYQNHPLPAKSPWNIVKAYLVGGFNLPLWKMMELKSVGMMFHSQLNGTSFKIPWFQSAPTSYKIPMFFCVFKFYMLIRFHPAPHRTLLGFQVDAAQRRRRLLASREDGQSGGSHKGPRRRGVSCLGGE